MGAVSRSLLSRAAAGAQVESLRRLRGSAYNFGEEDAECPVAGCSGSPAATIALRRPLAQQEASALPPELELAQVATDQGDAALRGANSSLGPA